MKKPIDHTTTGRVVTEDQRALSVESAKRVKDKLTENLEPVQNSIAEQRLNKARSLDEQLQKELLNVSQSFFMIGYYLNAIINSSYYRTLGYETIEAYAEEKYNLKKSSIYNLIAVYRLTYQSSSPSLMQEVYTGYDFNKLVAFCRCKFAMDSLLMVVKPEDRTKDIEEFIRYWNKYTEKHSTTPKYKSIEEFKVSEKNVEKVNNKSDEFFQTSGKIEELEPVEEVQNVEPVKEEPDQVEVSEVQEKKEVKKEVKIEFDKKEIQNTIALFIKEFNYRILNIQGVNVANSFAQSLKNRIVEYLEEKNSNHS